MTALQNTIGEPITASYFLTHALLLYLVPLLHVFKCSELDDDQGPSTDGEPTPIVDHFEKEFTDKLVKRLKTIEKEFGKCQKEFGKCMKEVRKVEQDHRR